MKKIIVCMMACILACEAWAELVVNGSFESGTNPGSSTPLYSVDSTSIPGWTVSSGDIDYIGTRWVAGDGGRCLDLSGTGAGVIQQLLPCVTTGQWYRLSFKMAGNPELGGGIRNMRVHVGSYTQDFVFNSASFSTTNMGWTNHVIDFVPLTNSLELKFESLNASWSGPALDCVSVQQLTASTCLANGSFESGTSPGSSTQINSVNSTSVTSWTVDTGNIDYVGTRWTAGDGARCIDLSGSSTGSIAQTVSCLNPGDSYRLAFLMAGNPEDQGVKNMRVHIGAYTQDFAFNSTGKSTSNLGWITNSIDFLATTNTLTFKFQSLTARWGGPTVDRVTLTEFPAREWIVNGSFECGIDPGTSTQLDAPDAASIVGWSLDNESIDYIGTRWVAGDGVRCLDMSGLDAATISQTVSCLATGETYRLTFLMAGNPEVDAGVKELRVTVGGTSEDFDFDSTGKSTSNMGWVQKSLEFVPTTSSVTITFTSLTPGWSGPALDKVSLKLVP